MSDTEPSGADRQLGLLIEALTRALPLLERIAVALERSPIATGVGSPENLEDHERIQSLAADDLRARIEAAKLANDPDGAMNSRDELARLLPGEAIKDIDLSLVKWLLTVIQRRLRTGTIRPDVVDLAGRVADRFGATTEGASLQAALPTLRRSAGLCPKCGEPYTGLGDACPKCVAAASPGSLEVIEEDPEIEFVGEEIDLNQERFWNIPTAPDDGLDGDQPAV